MAKAKTPAEKAAAKAAKDAAKAAKAAAAKAAKDAAKAAKAAAATGASGGITADQHEEVNDSAEVGKGGNSIKATGKFEVVEIADGQFRMFNEVGQAVSPVVEGDEKTEHGKPALTKLKKDAARNNALLRSRQIRTPAGHEVR